jgi:putative DNA primase/helicase
MTTAAANGVPVLERQHLEDLHASGLSDEQISLCGFYSEKSPSRVSELLRWKSPATKLGPCLVIPFAGPDGKPTDYARVKPSRPRKDAVGKPVKYESPAHRPNRAYFPPATRAALGDLSVPLLLTEGEKKSAKADQEGFPCVGLVGVWGWQKKREDKSGPRELIEDLAAVAWEGREVYLVFDSDLASKPDVQRAEYRLAEALRAKGASVKAVRLPAGENGAKVGLDDYLVAHGAEALRGLLAEAVEAERPAADGSGRDFHLTDHGNAIRMAEAHRADLRHCHPWGKWHVWDGLRWREDDSAETTRRAKQVVADLFREAAGRLKDLSKQLGEKANASGE